MGISEEAAVASTRSSYVLVERIEAHIHDASLTHLRPLLRLVVLGRFVVFEQGGEGRRVWTCVAAFHVDAEELFGIFVGHAIAFHQDADTGGSVVESHEVMTDTFLLPYVTARQQKHSAQTAKRSYLTKHGGRSPARR